MSRHRSLSVVLALVIGLAVSACAKKAPAPAPPPPPPPPATTPAPPPPPPPPPPAPAPPPVTLTEQEVFSRMSLEELNAKRPLNDVFFGFDRFDLGDESRAALDRNSSWMKQWASTKVMVEGHCDSRGTAEYNIGLGDRRATAVKNYLTSLGVPADRIATVSKGKEAPFCNEENESCWAQNRRGHFVITAK